MRDGINRLHQAFLHGFSRGPPRRAKIDTSQSLKSNDARGGCHPWKPEHLLLEAADDAAGEAFVE
jgi:hypothetical protein